jgi:hypothetical protein
LKLLRKSAILSGIPETLSSHTPPLLPHFFTQKPRYLLKKMMHPRIILQKGLEYLRKKNYT